MLQTTILYIGRGLAVTLGVTGVALPVGFGLGLLTSILAVYGGKVVSRGMSVYSVVMRGTPPVVLLFLLYFVLARNINISPFWAGSISLGVISGAYQMEIARGAILSVGTGQMIAARSIGMTQWQAIRHIVLPQALRIAIAPWSNEVAVLLKNSSLVYVIGVPEILRRAQHVSARTHEPLLAYAIAAGIYFLMVFAASRLLETVERRTEIPSI